MFKSVFAKYVTAVMAIFTVGFILLLAVITAIVNSYVTESKTQELDNTVTALRDCLDHAAVSIPADQFGQEAVEILSDRQSPVTLLFSALTLNDSDLTLVLSDQRGEILYIIGTEYQNGVVSPGMKLSPEIIATVKCGDGYFQSVAMPFAKKPVPTQAIGIFNAEGKFCGSVSASLTKLSWGQVMQEMTESVASAALLILLAAMIAIYFISNRIISPLREMSTAARDFAKGKFDTRVSVRGRDEVAQLAIAFNNMAESLENLEKMRSTFVANISHDLRTPMTTIAGFIEEIREGVIPPEEQDHYLEIISGEVKRLSRLVASLLDLSRIQAGDRKFVMKPFDICEMGRRILISFEQQIDEKHLQVEFLCDEDRMTVTADHDAIYQIFYNICHNAVKFSSEGGALRIRITEIRERKILVSVFNEGSGIPADDLPYIFERFYKSDKSRGLDKTGLGLGLYIAKTIIEAHGERIWVESEEGKNCEFFFTLPEFQQVNLRPEITRRANSER